MITRLNVGRPAIHALNLSSRLSAHGVETLLVHGTIGDAEGDMSYLLEQWIHGRARSMFAPCSAAGTGARADRLVQIYRAFCAFQPHIVHTHMAQAANRRARARPREGVPHLRTRTLSRLAARSGCVVRGHRRVPPDLAQRRHTGGLDRRPCGRLRRRRH